MHAPIVLFKKASSCTEIIYDRPASRSGTRSVYFDGCGVIDGVFIRNARELALLSPHSLNIENKWRGCSGSFCIYIEDSLRTNVYPDPLGGCLVYKYECKDFIAYSSDLSGMVSYLNKNDPSVHLDPFYLALLVTIGNGAHGFSSYNSIQVLEGGTYVELSKNGAQEKRYFSFLDLISSDSYQSYRDRSIEDIHRNIAAIKAAGFEHVICHITGGFDSRLVAAALQSAGFAQECNFFCSGPSTMPDKTIAYGLAQKLGWRLTSFNGLVGGPNDPHDQLISSVRYASGMRSSSPVTDDHEFAPNYLVLSGGYGECYRSFYSHNSERSRRCFWSQKKPVNERATAAVNLLTFDYLERSLRDGLSYQQALDLMYVEQRNRYFVGNLATLFSRKTARFDPLYSINGIAAALLLSPAMRSDNLLGYEVMQEIHAPLLQYKFNSRKFGASVFERDAGVGSKALPPLNAETVHIHDLAPSVQAKPAAREAMSPSDLALAKAMGATAWQVRDYAQVQRRCKAALSVSHLRDYAETALDTSYVIQLCEQTQPRNRVELRNLFAVYSFLTFFHAETC